MFKKFALLFSLALLLTLLLALPRVSAQEPPKPQPWQIDGILAALDDDYPEVQGYALGELTGYEAEDLESLLEQPEEIARKVVTLLQDETVDPLVHRDAAEALGNLGEALTPYASEIIEFLKDKTVDSEVRSIAAEALGKIGQLQLDEVPIVLNNLYYDSQQQVAWWRFQTYFLGGGTEEVKTLLQWLGKPKTLPDTLSYEERIQTLELFARVWQDSQDLEELQNDLAQKIASIAAAKNISWQPQDLALLQTHYNNLKTSHPTPANAVLRVIENLES